VTNKIDITVATSVAASIEAGRMATASCLLGAGSSLSVGSIALRGTGVFTGTDGFGGGSERPTWAPVARQARIFGYAPAANGAEHRALLANGNEAAAPKQLSKMRAFRGLEPWRDPA
jgi:hypothetical protein